MKRWIVLGSIGVLVIVVASVLGPIYINRWLAEPRGRTQEEIIVTSGAQRIQGYEQFYDLIEERDAHLAKLRAYPETLNRREATECRGLVSRIADIVAEYNATSRAERTVGRWRADNLPQLLEHEEMRNCAEGGN